MCRLGRRTQLRRRPICLYQLRCFLTTSSQNQSKNQRPDWIQLVSLSLAAIFFIIGLIILCYIVWTLSYQYRFQDEINLEASSRFGDYVGGVIGTLWSLTGVLLFFSSLWTQRREFALQREELSLQRIEMRNQRQEYATMRVIEVMYRQLDLLSKKEEELSLIFPKLQNQSQAHSVTGKLVIQDFTQYVIKRLRPKSLFNPSEYQIELLDILFSYVTSSTGSSWINMVKQ